MMPSDDEKDDDQVPAVLAGYADSLIKRGALEQKKQDTTKQRILRLFARRWSADVPRRVVQVPGSVKDRRSGSLFAGAYVRSGAATAMAAATSLASSPPNSGCFDRFHSYDQSLPASRAAGTGIGASVEGCHDQFSHVTLQGGRRQHPSAAYRRSKSDNALSHHDCTASGSQAAALTVDVSELRCASSSVPEWARQRRHSGNTVRCRFTLGDGSEPESGGSEEGKICGSDSVGNTLTLCATCAADLQADEMLDGSGPRPSTLACSHATSSSKQLSKLQDCLAVNGMDEGGAHHFDANHLTVPAVGDCTGSEGRALCHDALATVKQASARQPAVRRSLPGCSSCGTAAAAAESSIKKDNFMVRFEVTKETENILLPAVKGITLGELLTPLLQRRRLSADDVNAFLDFSCTALSLHSDTFHLGGASLRITGRDEAPKRPFSIVASASSGSDRAPRTQEFWNNSESPYRKNSAGNIAKASVVGRSLSSASLPCNSRRAHWRERTYEAAATAAATGVSLAGRLGEGYTEDPEMINQGSGTATAVTGGSSLTASSRRRLTGQYLSGSTGDETGPVPDVSPGSTISRGSRTSHRITSAFFSHGTKEKEKSEKLAACLDGWSHSGLPAMPDLYAMCHPRHETVILEIEDHWTSFIESKDLTQKQKDLQEALWELVYTEAEYIRSLNVINDLFVCCLLNLQNEQLLNDIDVEQLFSNISEIIRTNMAFWETYMLPLLHASRSTSSQLDARLLKPAFAKFNESFYAYTKYCLDHGSCSAYMKKAEKENELFKTFVAWAEAQKQCNRLKLHDLLVKPMQRLTRYSLLLRAIAKKAEESDVQADLSHMVESVDRFVKQVNRALHQKHEADKLQSLAARIEAYDAVDMPYNDQDSAKLLLNYANFDIQTPIPGCGGYLRHLLYEGPLKMKDSSTKQDVYCFLFTDLLLITKASKRADKVKIIKAPIVVDRIIAEEHSKDGNPYLLLLHMCEYGVAQAAYAFHGDKISKWAEMLGRAKEVLLKIKSIRPSEDQSMLDRGLVVIDESDVDAEVSYVSQGLRRVSSSASNFEGLVTGLAASVDSLSSCGTDHEEQPAQAAAASSSMEQRLCPEAGLSDRRSATALPEGLGCTMCGSPVPDETNFQAAAVAQHKDNGTSRCLTFRTGSPCANLNASLQLASPPEEMPVCNGGGFDRGPVRLIGEKVQHLHNPGDKLSAEDFSKPMPGKPYAESLKAGKGGGRRRPGYERRYRTAGAIEELRANAKDTAIHKRLSWNLGSVTAVADDQGFSRRSSRAVSTDSVRSSTSGVSSINSGVQTSPEEAHDIYEEEEEEEGGEKEDEQADEEEDASGANSDELQYDRNIPTVGGAEQGGGFAAAMPKIDDGTRDEWGQKMGRGAARTEEESEAHSGVEADEEDAVRHSRNAPSSYDLAATASWPGKLGAPKHQESKARSLMVKQQPLPQVCTVSASVGVQRRLTQAELLRMRNRLLLSAHEAAEV